MKRERKDKPKLTDAERHERFVDMAHRVEASDDPKDFDRAFDKVIKPPLPNATRRSVRTARDAERPLPDARRHVPGRAEG